MKYCRSMGAKLNNALMMGCCLVFSVGCFVGGYSKTIRNFPSALRIVLSLLYLYIVVNYLGAWLQAIFTNPGTPPKFMIEEHGGIECCNKCSSARPARCHHCSVCQLCRLRYDHHCPWVANCIGLFNHGYFLKFLLFALAGSALSLLVTVVGLLSGCFRKSSSGFWKYLEAAAYLFLELLSVICSYLMLKDNYNGLRHNETSLEIYQNALDKRKAEKAGTAFAYPYDKGFRQNLCEITGENTIMFLLLPFKTTGLTLSGFEFQKVVKTAQ